MQEMTNQDKRAVLYVRVAAARDGQESAAVARQRHTCRQIAATCGLTIVHEYVDMGQPARLQQRLALSHLLDDLATWRDAGWVVVADYARLTRNPIQLQEIIDRLAACGAKIITPVSVQTTDRFVHQQLADAGQTKAATEARMSYHFGRGGREQP